MDLHAAGSGMQATYTAGNVARANRGLRRLRGNTGPSRNNRPLTDEYSADVVSLLDLVGESTMHVSFAVLAKLTICSTRS